jgi:hypothetical protein
MIGVSVGCGNPSTILLTAVGIVVGMHSRGYWWHLRGVVDGMEVSMTDNTRGLKDVDTNLK